jgi:hypothetical protein
MYPVLVTSTESRPVPENATKSSITARLISPELLQPINHINKNLIQPVDDELKAIGVDAESDDGVLNLVNVLSEIDVCVIGRIADDRKVSKVFQQIMARTTSSARCLRIYLHSRKEIIPRRLPTSPWAVHQGSYKLRRSNKIN